MTSNPGPGRPSSLSRHPERAEVEVDILTGESITAIAAKTGLAARSLRRSAASLRAQAREAAEEAANVTVGTIAAAFVGVVVDAHEARVAAAEAGDARNRIAAQRAESAALRDLASVLGVNDTSILEELAEAEAIVKALRRAMPEFGAPLARALAAGVNAEGHDGLTDVFEQVAARLESKTYR